MNIGIVEDNQSMGEMLAKGLELSGHEVTTYTNAQDCLRAVFLARFNGEQLPHDIIVTDLDLKESIDGAEMIRRIRHYIPASELPFLLMSGRNLVERNLLSQNLLDIRVMPKPVTAKEILKEVKRGMGNKE